MRSRFLAINLRGLAFVADRGLSGERSMEISSGERYRRRALRLGWRQISKRPLFTGRINLPLINSDQRGPGRVRGAANSTAKITGDLIDRI